MEKIKQFLGSGRGKDHLTVMIIVLVGLGSYELGRLSMQGNSGIKIEYTAQEANAATVIEYVEKTSKIAPATTSRKNFFASSKGRKYYPVTCSAGKTIKIENRVYFATKTEAEKAGYELSSSCR